MIDLPQKKRIENRPLIQRYITGLPDNCLELLLPLTESELDQFEMNLRQCRIDEEIRHSVLAVQKRFNLPLRAHESIRETMTRLRVKRLRRRRNRNL